MTSDASRGFILIADMIGYTPYDLDGGHFGLLCHPSDPVDRASRLQADFLTKHLLPRP